LCRSLCALSLTSSQARHLTLSHAPTTGPHVDNPAGRVKQPTPAAASPDLITISVASGVTNRSWAADEEDFERLIKQSPAGNGPTLIGVRVDDKGGGPPDAIPFRSGSDLFTGLACGSRCHLVC
jgi:hypothetical protein